ncbi:MAG: phosphotransferase [Bryobacteraceae bacterium]|nr:phosphotransferase [Bryobacteraceae bacterium]
MTHPEETIPVRSAHAFDSAALQTWLADRLEGCVGPVEIRQFAGGQSNPTFHVSSGERSWVLRKQPPGKLLPSAHAVDREFRVIRALAGSGVPVCRAHVFCEDSSIIGTPFYVVDYVPGRVFRNPQLPGLQPLERAAIYDAMNQVLARLHQVDYRAAGLEDFGKSGSYYVRQISRWSRQYLASRTDDLPAMDLLIEWLNRNIPETEETTLIHGDYRLENMIWHQWEPRPLAVLDWELSTLGHPLGDLAYNCMVYRLEDAFSGSLGGIDLAPLGIPSETQYVEDYCRRTGRDRIENWPFYMGFSIFRSASILQGVYYRGLQGNASSERALQAGKSVRMLAEQGWATVQG